uniref:Activating signal cointegrator 1 complex subunit 3 n=1 Tax=Meloidogyne hapla TaxID=6305 RepID=A0A1I8BS09_MELHA
MHSSTKKIVKESNDNIHETLFTIPSSVTLCQEDGPSTSSFTDCRLKFFYKPELIKWENKFFEIDEKDEEEEEANLSQFINEQQQNTNYFDCQTKFVNLPVHGCKMALPEGSTSKSLDLCEEIHIPPPIDNNKKFLASFPRLKINELDELVQTAFEGIKSLNVIQSQVFDKAYNTLNNLLICAPTGAGKTNIALLAILRTIRDNRIKNGRINKKAFKVIYLAPMKALATEMTSNFSKRLSRLGLKTRELTGDSQLSRKEIQETQVLVLTPEKWDVITRKSDDEELSQLVRLLIIDEVHLLHDDRGPVIEAIIARTHRRIEVFHQNIRIVGLSATLPNYYDVATFLRVDPTQGLFHFDGRFRPVPLAQTFLGVRDSERQAFVLQREREKAIRKGEKPPTRISQNKLMTQKEMMDEICFQKCVKFLHDKHQVLVFVHSRNATGQLAKTFIDKAAIAMNNAQSRELQFLFQSGLGIHHAGLSRHDRHLMEKMFTEGAIRVMMCTATLAWGVNLPAYAVIIRGTEIFDPQKGIFTDIGILDVQQIFGRAGRPQYEDMGQALLITSAQKLAHYIEMFHRQTPIESQFQSRILNNLNAEIASGAISNISEAIEWIHFTYFYIRLRKNPLQYGVDWKELRKDSQLNAYLSDFCHNAAKRLDANRMIRYDPINNFVSATDLGRIASNYYIGFETIELINDHNGPISLTEMMTDETIIALISSSTEFAQIKNRDSEMAELDELASFGSNLKIRSGLATTAGKVNCLLQSYISRAYVKDFALSSELYYISQNAGRIARAIFEIALRRGWAQTTEACLIMAKCIEQRLWPFNSPLRHLADVDILSFNIVQKIESRRMNLFALYDMDPKDLGYLCSGNGKSIYEAIRMLPYIEVEANIRPITWTHLCGGSQRFWVIVEDADANIILHHEIFILLKKTALSGEPQRLIFTIPVNEDQVKHQYLLRVASDRFIVEDTVVPLTLASTVMPTSIKPHTDLLDLDPLPLSALKNGEYQQLYSFQFFNPVQTQVFHTLYATDENALIGAPTSSGKTLCAELAIFRLFNLRPLKKCVYIAPLKALVRERVLDWEEKFSKKLGFPIVEVSGDNTPDLEELNLASILVTTPEKWDGITRCAETRRYVQEVELLIIDEIHLLGVERGAVLEAIVTRIKTLARRRELAKLPIRIIGLSTALANAGDVADWIGVPDSALFNFRPSVRPVPVQVHIQGFPGQHYCPRMGLMNKPAFQYIKQFSPSKPVLIFVASRRQTRLTAMALLSLLQREPDSKQYQWLKMEQLELETLLKNVRDDNLALTLNYGIGMHHAGLQHAERALVERLFVERKIQILVATATLAWGINVPAHLVIVKGTEYYDGKTHKYIDFPVTDVLQMIGRAGRPQYDTSAVAVVFVQDTKKNFYKRFLYEPFPVESNLLPVLANHVNAEICSGSIVNRQQIVEYLAGTYLYRRLFANPAYYGIEQLNSKELTTFLSTTVDDCLVELCASFCILPDLENDGYIHPTPFGRMASRYYLEHRTIRHFKERICPGMSVEQLLLCLTECPEYQEIPVRHNEDQINREIQSFLPIKLETMNWESPHVKTHLLYQAHFSRMHLPVDYTTDQRSIIESCIRILQAMFDFCVEMHLLNTSLNVLILQQQIFQARWYSDHPLLCLPHLSAHSIDGIGPLCSIPQLKDSLGIYTLNNEQKLNKKEERRIIIELCSKSILNEKEADELLKALLQWPILSLEQVSLPQRKQRQKVDEKLIINIGMSEKCNNSSFEFCASTNYKLFVSLRLCGPYWFTQNAFCPKFPKKRTAGWILLLGETTNNRLWGHERIPSFVEENKIARLRILTPDEPGIYQLLLLVISDTYLGIDQQYMLNFKVK